MTRPLPLVGLDLQEHLRDPGQKQRYVTAVFEIVASSYDRFTRWCSLGLDMAWKRELLGLVKSHLRHQQGAHHVVDLATGTGDLAFALAPFVHEGKIIGLDISQEMIRHSEQIRRKRKLSNVEFRVGDMMNLPLPSGCSDAITVGYGLRNCPDVQRAIEEIQRVLKPGGILAILDFVRPGNALWERTFLRFLLLACNFFGWLWHREPEVYGYLAHSIGHFLSVPELAQALAKAGFQVLAIRPKLTGMIGILLARKLT